MSTPLTDPPASTSTLTSTASESTSTQSSTGSSTTDATLYLYTFLATLVLLLAVSSAIVIRSLILRRRHQRLVEEAIRTGTWLPHRFDSPGTRRRRDVGQRPTFWEAWVHPQYIDTDGDGGDGDVGECDIGEKRRWMDVHPVYAAYVGSPTTPAKSLPPQSQSADASRAGILSRARFILPFTPRRSQPLAQPVTAAIASQTSLSNSAPASIPTTTTVMTSKRGVRVGLLIAMPHATRGHVSEHGPPVVEIGITDVVVMDDKAQSDG